MSKSPDDILKSPDDSLSHYFDDLLGGYDGFDQEESHAIPMAANAGMGRVVALPTKKKSEPKSPRSLRAQPKPKALKKPQFAEPELEQTQEQKLRLEKLLQSARPQLLVETSVVPEVQVQTKTDFVHDPTEIQEWDIELPVIETGAIEAGVIETGIADAISEVAVQEAIAEEVQTAAFQMEGLEWHENGRPLWAQSRFDVLLFQVSGLTLAVPLISLGQIQPLTDELTPLFGQADWFMGLQPTPAGKIRTINTAKFVMPERYDPRFVETAKYVMSINGVPWGLAVDSVNQPITLMPEDVKWRGDRSKRPWLAGTVKDHMCALLDIPRIGQMLVEADKNFMHG